MNDVPISETSGLVEVKTSEEFSTAQNRLREQGRIVTMLERGKKGVLWVFHWYKPKEQLKQAELI